MTIQGMRKIPWQETTPATLGMAVIRKRFIQDMENLSSPFRVTATVSLNRQQSPSMKAGAFYRELVISLYAKGISISDIEEEMREIYEIQFSTSAISIITNEVNQAAQKWQNRPLNTVYMIVRMDGIVVKVRDNGRIINKTVYLCVGLKQNGLKEVLGMWVGKSESSSFRIGVLTDLKARGVQDILITYADNLNGFTDTIRTVFPSYSLKSVWYIRSETLVNMSFIRTRKSLRQI